MTMILNESLRLYPPVVLITRKVAREVRLGKLVLPAGLELAISPLIVHRNPQLWGEDVHLFKPERFSEGEQEQLTTPCLSFHLVQALRSVWGKALQWWRQQYTLTISPSYVHAHIRHITTRPQYGLQVILNNLQVWMALFCRVNDRAC